LTKITIATPAFGEMFYTPYVQTIYRLMRAFERRKWDSAFSSISYADIAESRNFLLTRWFDKSDATHLLFIDADMGFPAQLVLDMVDSGKPIVGAVYPKRQIDIDKIVRLAAAGETASRAIAKGHDYIVRRKRTTPNSRGPSGFIQVDGCGTGAMLIRRDAIQSMLRKMPQLSDSGARTTSPLAKDLDRLIRAFEPLRLDGALLSEDFSFCRRWTECGGEIWANVNYEIEHIGLHRFKGRYTDPGPQLTVAQPEKVVVSERGLKPKRSVTQRVRVVTSSPPVK
jgi:hypothetical protein